MQAASLEQAFVHAAFGRIALNAQRLAVWLGEHRLDQVAARSGSL